MSTYDFFVNAIFESNTLKTNCSRPVYRHGTRASTLSDVNTHINVCVCISRDEWIYIQIARRQCISEHVYLDSFVIHDIEHRVLLMSYSSALITEITIITIRLAQSIMCSLADIEAIWIFIH